MKKLKYDEVLDFGSYHKQIKFKSGNAFFIPPVGDEVQGEITITVEKDLGFKLEKRLLETTFGVH